MLCGLENGLFLGRALILLDYLSKEEVLGANSLLGALNTSGLRSVEDEATKGFILEKLND